MAILGHEYINKLLKPFFKIRQSKISLNQTLTLKLGVTLVLTVTQVYVFVNLRWETSAATLIPNHTQNYAVTISDSNDYEILDSMDLYTCMHPLINLLHTCIHKKCFFQLPGERRWFVLSMLVLLLVYHGRSMQPDRSGFGITTLSQIKPCTCDNWINIFLFFIIIFFYCTK